MGAEVDLDPEGLRRVADELGALRHATQRLAGHVTRGGTAVVYVGAPDAGGSLAAELAGRCDEVMAALSRAGNLASALADELRASADAGATADRRSEQQLRAATEGMV